MINLFDVTAWFRWAHGESRIKLHEMAGSEEVFEDFFFFTLVPFVSARGGFRGLGVVGSGVWEWFFVVVFRFSFLLRLFCGDCFTSWCILYGR